MLNLKVSLWLLYHAVTMTRTVQSSLSETLSGRFCIISAKNTEQPPRRYLRILPSPSPNSYIKASLAGEACPQSQRRT